MAETQTELNPKSPSTKEETEKLLQQSEISLLLDSYDDIFSDFDPRPYNQRALSQDFLAESQRAARDKASGQIQLKFMILGSRRDAVHEALIKKRLKEHFKKHLEEARAQVNQVIRQGVVFAVIGIVLMFAATLVLFRSPETTMLTSFLVIFLEPAGWFFFWEGLNLVIFESKKMRPNLKFYEKMAKSELSFLS